MDFREKRGPITIAIANNWAWLVIASLLAKRQTQDIRASLFLDGYNINEMGVAKANQSYGRSALGSFKPQLHGGLN